MVNKKLGQSVTFKFLIIVSVILFVSTVIISALIAVNEREMLHNSLTTKGNGLASYIVKLSKDPLIMRDSIQLDSIVNQAVKDEEILYAVVQDASGNSLTSQYASIDYYWPRVKKIVSGIPRDSKLKDIIATIRMQRGVIEVSTPIVSDTDPIGKVILGMSEHKINQQIVKTIIFIVVLNLVVMFILGAVLFVVSKKLILDPITALVQATTRFGKGELTTRVEIKTTGEVQILIESFNLMMEDLGKAIVSKENELIERKRAENTLAEREDLLRRVIETIPVGLWITDAKGTIVLGNEAGQRIWAGARYVGLEQYGEYKGWWADTGKRIEPEEWAAARAVTKGEISLDEEINIECFDGIRKTILNSAIPLWGAAQRITGAIIINQDITERKQAEKMLRESENKFRFLSQEFRDLLDAIPDSLMRLDKDFKVIWANKAAAKEIGKRPDKIIGQHCYALWHGLEKPCDPCPVVQSFETGKPMNMVITRPDGRVWDQRTVLLINDKNDIINVIEVSRDITGHRKLEEQLQQAQKMESVGRLAGGVAHDFNNLLTTIIGNAEIVLMDEGKEESKSHGLEEILKAGEKAAGLTRQLLAFSRKQVFQPEVADLNEVVSEMAKILRRLIGEDIELKTVLAPNLGRVEADVGQIEQVIMNLAVNAKDAMSGGGKLTIETANVELDEQYAATHAAVRPGPYVLLSVSDNGIGIIQEVQSRIFEPFFTTKEKGRGTGLGLATVYGIVKQSLGNIWVYSEPGQGTTFKIYLPRQDKLVEDVKRQDPKAECRGGSETVLLVEDEESVRNLALKMLERFGYQVLTAQDGLEAWELFERHGGPIGLLLTDVVMPRMSGRELAEKLEGLQSGIKVLYMSGYTDDVIVHHGILNKGIAFIQKPFTPEDLVRKVREVLDS